MGGHSSGVSDRVWTVPNILSMLRLLLVPVFLVLVVAGEYVPALVVLVVASLTDLLDGYLARRLGQITRLGQLLDPAADRLYIFAALLGLAANGLVPWWIVVVIVARDVFLLVLGIVLANHGYGPLPVHQLGKAATFALFSGVPIIMLGLAFPQVQPVSEPIGWAVTIWGAFLYWWAGVIYAIETARVVRQARVSPPPASDTLEQGG
ncbi:CDP-alcohol phosphatidyltransferase family protein [Agromyces marinus]|uniref:CDP-diacylglycerol--glycerol-3-phosphate 3-phosphatidyltransferase n=1 Tax=Agromyces marinus TaxID=1389020 RepID=A0ABM8GY07_9MICO|nr:CDP-alcohol phosphatidyltransferase family protein [Agromyces marinus]UIP58406.1 Putative cardiolipin synthase [Agromyces marinus]BDZ53339.1 CDP-diacylglycerol--glycerol-3-phosphate 3-phosphatidyltransferase [Agromyces marinus]